jgi:hypothetical protein
VLAALLASCWSPMSLLLPLNPISAIQDLPLTLPSVISQDDFRAIAESVTSKLVLLLKTVGESSSVDGNEHRETLRFLQNEVSITEVFAAVKKTCIGLKQFLPRNSIFSLVTMKYSR